MVMSRNLVIVESPAKAKTIENILGKDYIVKSSFGHIRDLPKKGLGIDTESNFRLEYEVSLDKKNVVADLKRSIKSVDNVWLASDEDREGEAIAWHLAQVLGLDAKQSNRIVFHEITSTAINKAIENPRSINLDLVDAQQARRALDRLVGFELSPVLWRKVKPSLSAGRVQSVAVRLIVEREREIIAFKAQSSFKITAVFSSANGDIKTELSHRFSTEQEAIDFIKESLVQNYFVESVDKKPGTRSSSAPFTTSTLQQEASRKLGYSVSQTMRVAQTLYESGYITYMRTDSVNLSNDALTSIESEVKKNYGEQYHKLKKHTTKAKGAQEAHEAIRPTYFEKQSIEGTSQEQKLYSLIWKRTVASQMSDAKIEKTIIKVGYENIQYSFEAKGEVVVFDGFLRLNDNTKEDVFLPIVAKGDVVKNINIEGTERFEQKPPRYSEAALVKQLEELGIGRPSTYAPTISTIINRGYVVKEDREGIVREYKNIVVENNTITSLVKTENTGAEKSKLFPTDIGMIVNDYLKTNFADILDYNFTANVEKTFDDIAEGRMQWQNMLKDFYGKFHETVVAASDYSSGYAVVEARLLGQDPATGKNVYSRMGRFGAMVQLGESEDTPKYAGLKKGQLIETVTIEQALDLFKLPRQLGEFEDKVVTVGLGRFGAYIRHDSKFVSIPKDSDPYEITFSECVDLILAKRQSDIEKILKTFPEDEKLQVLNGRFGAYIHYDGQNYKVDKAQRETLSEITFEAAMEIVNTTTPTSSARKTVKKKVSAKKAAAAKKPAAPKKVTTKKSAIAKKSIGKKTVAKKATATKKPAATKKTVTPKE